MLAIYKRELDNYLQSPVGYVFLGMFALIFSMMFAFFNISAQSASLSAVFQMMTFAIMLLIPILTMRLLSEDKANKTDQLLFCAPVSTFDIVFGKFLAASALVLFGLVTTLPHLAILAFQGNPPAAATIAIYVGFFLLALAYMSIGIFISSFTESQVVSAFITFGIFVALLFVEGFLINMIPNQTVVTVLSWFSIMKRFGDFSIGVLNFAQVVYYVSVIAIFLFLTTRRLEKRRWS